MNGDQILVAVLSSLSKRLQEIFCTVKGPIPASAVTLSQQPRIGGKYQYIIAIADLPIYPSRRRYLLTRRLYIVCDIWSHVGKYAAVSRLVEALLEIYRKSPSTLSDLLARDVLTRQDARDGRLRGGLLSL
ncbi:hypothetical protein T03_4471 [Trichinella britovi]|uniref:Uncharacterized protein n=1 Tax=Trichinella britovi TaxID=45882 RepID=A0A0V1C012_TRIBR|nr:hypothetical protein T03_4471 [Trichinella britovi]